MKKILMIAAAMTTAAMITTTAMTTAMTAGTTANAATREGAAGAARLTVKRVYLGEAPAIERVDEMFETGGLELHEIGVVNWPERAPDRPDVKFRIAHSDDEIYIKYYVREEALRAVYESDGNRPWEESCVEFFVSPGAPGDAVYYNVEMNCIGYGILQGGAPGGERPMMDEVAKIRRLPSMPREAFGVREGQDGGYEWTLTVAIPAEVFSMSPAAALNGRVLRGNFYKCGDLLPRPHWVTWSPITGTRPTFHSPESFGELVFE